MQPLQHHFGLYFISANQCFHAPITSVAYPAGDTKAIGLLLGEVAKTYTLNSAGNADAVVFCHLFSTLN